jgi:UDP-GlcNAc:undecaprenyl-phosphate/decaprenyl-phosphate GlcNAc-1-phosphate transferase
MYGILVAAFVAALITAAITPSVRRWSEKIGAVDQPSARRINKTPLPRIGGVAICVGFLIAALLTVTVRQFSREGQHTWTLQVAGVLAAVLFAAIVGLVDDLKDLSPRMQILGMVGAGVILVSCGIRIEGITNPLGGVFGRQYDPLVNWHPLSAIASVLLTVLWVFTVTKTVDAIDGSDGVASGVCAISAGTLALMATMLHTPEGPTVALLAAAVAGSCLGFLRHNYHPAKIIMGTVGAWGLGVALSAISILGAFKVAAAVSVLVPVLVLGVPLFDYTHVVARRIIERAPLMKADKRHLHHRLLARGWNQHQVAWFIYSVEIIFCLVAFAIFQYGRIPH